VAQPPLLGLELLRGVIEIKPPHNSRHAAERLAQMMPMQL
jgi:hypothetical protein